MRIHYQIFLGVVIAIILIASLIVVGFSQWKSRSHGRSWFTASVTPTEFQISVNPTLPPVASFIPQHEIPDPYPGAQWLPPNPQIFTFILRPGEYVDVEGENISSLPVKTYPNDFIDYYKQELTARKWKQTSEADGEGHWNFWHKNGYYFVFGFIASRDTEGYVLFVEHN